MQEIEELGIEPPTVPIRSVGDLLWLFKAIDLKRSETSCCLLSWRAQLPDYSRKLILLD
jgi:hypothetical protein